MFSGSNATITLARRCRIGEWASIPLFRDLKSEHFGFGILRWPIQAEKSVGCAVADRLPGFVRAAQDWRGA